MELQNENQITKSLGQKSTNNKGHFSVSSILSPFQLPSFVFSEEYQCDLIEKTVDAFNNKTLGVVGEMIWNFADFMTKQVCHKIKS